MLNLVEEIKAYIDFLKKYSVVREMSQWKSFIISPLFLIALSTININ